MYHSISRDSEPCSKGQREEKDSCPLTTTTCFTAFVLLTWERTVQASPMMRKASELQMTLTDFFFMLVKRKEEEE